MKRKVLILLACVFGASASSSAMAACGCTNMTVTRSQVISACSTRNLGNFDGQCLVLAPGAGDNDCGGGAYKYTCPTGVNSQDLEAAEPTQSTGFFVQTAYAGGSNGAECTAGQILQMTITSGGNNEPNPNINPTSLNGNQTIGGRNLRIDNNGAHAFPRIGTMEQQRPKFGGDNYMAANVNVLSGSSNAGSWWWDNTDQTKDEAAEAATWAYEFVAFVQGSGGGQPSCACTFTIDVGWDSNQHPGTAYAYNAGNSVNCGGLQ